MKKRLFLLFLLFALTAKSFSSDNLFCLGLDWQLSIRGGIEHKFNHRLGMKYDIGISIIGLLVADALVTVYLLPEDSRWELNICAGIPNFSTPITFEGAMLSFGGSLLTRFKINEKVSIDLRIGEGYPLFFEKDKDIIRDIHFPLNLWPDFVLGVSFSK